jgi:hypothetical protein
MIYYCAGGWVELCLETKLFGTLALAGTCALAEGGGDQAMHFGSTNAIAIATAPAKY